MSGASIPKGAPRHPPKQQKSSQNQNSSSSTSTNRSNPQSSPHLSKSKQAQERYEQVQRTAQMKSGAKKTQQNQQQNQQNYSQNQKSQNSDSLSNPQGTPPSKGSLGPSSVDQSGKQHRLATNDFDTVFRNSRLSTLFTQPQNHKSFWSLMEDGDTVHLMGSRRLVDPHGTTQETTFCLVQRTLDKRQSQILDRYVALDYDSGMPFEQYLTTTIDENGTNGTAIDKDQESGDVISRTFLRLRGEPWKWHSSIAMSKIEPKVKAHMSQEYIDSLPDTYAVSRSKFTENGFLTEKMIKQNDLVVLTVVDELKITTKKAFEAKVEKIFGEYSQMLQEQIEKNAESFQEGDEADFGDFGGDDNFEDFKRQAGGGNQGEHKM